MHGYTSCTLQELKYDPALKGNVGNGADAMFAVITELCPHGNLEDFMEREGVPLSPEVKLDIMLQVAKGLEQLKDARIVWRDLKAKNLLVRSAHRGRAGEVVKVAIAFTDWGTAVKMPEEGKRRMTLHGPGTAGYIAPDTRGPIYDYQADMWAYLVWAASMCLKVECIIDCQLEEAIADLKLEKKANATSGQDNKVNELLRKFQCDGKVDEGCDDLYELVRDAAPWVDASMRWSPEEAEEELCAFRADHGLVIDASAVQKEAAAPEPERKWKASYLLMDKEYGRKLEAEWEAKQQAAKAAANAQPVPVKNATTQPVTTTRPVTTEPEAIMPTQAAPAVEDDGDSDWDEEAPTQPIMPTQPAPELDEMDVLDEDDDEREEGAEMGAVGCRRVPSGVMRPVTKKADPYEFDLPEPEELDTSRSSAMDTSAVLEPTEDIAETEDEAEAEASDEEEKEEDEEEKEEEEDVDVDEDEREAQREAEAVADRWIGARVKKWFRLPKPRGRRKKGAPPPPDGEYVWGTVVETRARRMEVWAPRVPCAFVRYDDGDEEDMSLDECARWLADGRSTNSDGKNGAGKSKSKSKSKHGTKVQAPSKRKALGDVTNGSTHKSVKSVLNAKKALDVSGSTGGSSGKSSKSTPGSSGKKRGRQAPAFAVAAVDERGVPLGCSKCRYGRYGCATCRERAGVFETAVMIVESADDDPYDFGATTTYAADEMEDKENEPTAPAFKRAKRGAKNSGPRTLVPQSALAAANKPPARNKQKKNKPSNALAVVNTNTSAKRKPPSTAAEALEQCLLPIDVGDDASPTELAAALPPGVQLGCSKCRQGWRGCTVCRKRAGVWLPPAKAWKNRAGVGDSNGVGDFGLLALPAPGDVGVTV